LKGLLIQGSAVVVVKKVEETRAKVRAVNVFDIFTRGDGRHSVYRSLLTGTEWEGRTGHLNGE